MIWGQIAPYAVVAAAFVGAYILRRFGVIPFSPTETAAASRADRAEHELERSIEREAELNRRIGELEQTRSMKPILELQKETAALVVQAIEKLASFNGSMRAIHDGLEETNDGLRKTNETLDATVEALRMAAGLVVGTSEIESHLPRRRRSAEAE